MGYSSHFYDTTVLAASYVAENPGSPTIVSN